jgi:hypothetical protein
VSTASRESSSIPTTISAVPTIGNTLYRPYRVISWPLPIELTRTPAISGSIRSPDSVGLEPLTTWRYSGR